MLLGLLDLEGVTDRLTNVGNQLSAYAV